jgi:tetratricopeptide (TPR) repeat protein
VNVARAAMLGALIFVTPAQTPAPPEAHAHLAVSTTSAQAQAAFDRGLAMTYAFSVGQARLDFHAAAAADPACAMAWWGAALAETIDINVPQTDDGDARGAAAIAHARAQLASATPEERTLVAALAERYAPHATTAERFRAYANAMHAAALAYPHDADVLTVAAYARWNDVGSVTGDDGRPVAGALEMEDELDRALALDPANLGAHHLRIHLEEQLGRPERALADARFFDGVTFAPGMSHLPHMAGHVYMHLGDYDALIAANERALANDAAYFAAGSGEGQTYVRRYHDHDLDFATYGLTTQGRDAEARALVANEDAEMKLRVALRTRDPAALGYAAPHQAPARAIALARLGRTGDADAIVRAFRTAPDDDGETRATRDVAAAIVARAEGKLDRAESSYRAAIAQLGVDRGDPKTLWPIPPGEGLGAVLLERGRAAAAETVFRRELITYPNDPRLAFGLAEALRAQRKDDTAERAIVAREWRGAVPLTVGALG